MNVLTLLFCAGLAAAAGPAPAPRAPKLEYRGKLADAKGTQQTGTFLLHFRLWDSVQGGKQVWKESSYVHAVSGEFKALLGRKEPIPESVLASAYRLSIETPAGTGWIAEALEPVKVIGGSLPAPAAAAVPATPPVAAATPPENIPQTPAAAPVAAEVERLRQEVEKSKAEARRAREDAERQKERMDALEAKFEKKAPESRSSRIYVVRTGDTLRSVALRLYGSEEQWVDLYRANDDRIQRGGELIAGQLLLVPKAGE